MVWSFSNQNERFPIQPPCLDHCRRPQNRLDTKTYLEYCSAAAFQACSCRRSSRSSCPQASCEGSGATPPDRTHPPFTPLKRKKCHLLAQVCVELQLKR
ncbi:hypothetical protein L596_026432 [Steinernema carpocapsae]|uniref:Uncharacterized protein n=1 Tax=Steinernema carpocapsae TaxID=34508 RepID=A0A4U5M1E3_STECR|nr:hypothetical protein L596_026432 [Steinernema carpocapsae]